MFAPLDSVQHHKGPRDTLSPPIQKSNGSNVRIDRVNREALESKPGENDKD